jgi:hypothetical protein
MTPSYVSDAPVKKNSWALELVLSLGTGAGSEPRRPRAPVAGSAPLRTTGHSACRTSDERVLDAGTSVRGEQSTLTRGGGLVPITNHCALLDFNKYQGIVKDSFLSCRAPGGLSLPPSPCSGRFGRLANGGSIAVVTTMDDSASSGRRYHNG